MTTNLRDKLWEEWTAEELEALAARKREEEKARRIEEIKARIEKVQESLNLLEEKRQLYLTELNGLQKQLAQLEGRQPATRKRPGQQRRKRVGTHIRLPQIMTSGIVSVPLPIRAMVRGQTYKALVTEDGKVMYQGQQFRSLSGAAKQAVSWKTVDGWAIWHYESDDGKLHPLYHLRELVYRQQQTQEQDS